MLKRRAVSTAMLVSCALIWGTSYIAQILGMQEIGPLTFCASRYVVSVAALSLMLALMASGLNGQSFAFCGYLPAKTSSRCTVSSPAKFRQRPQSSPSS